MMKFLSRRLFLSSAGASAIALGASSRSFAIPSKSQDAQDGRDGEDAHHYTIAGCEREGEPLDVICRHPGTHDAQVLQTTVHSAMENYLKTHPVIAPYRDGREIAMDLPPVVFSQDAALAGGDLSTAPTTPSGLPGG